MTSLQFNSPSTIIISGPTALGKSTFLFRIMKEPHIFNQKFEKIIYFYSVWQSLFEGYDNEKVIFKKGIPNEEDIDVFADGNHNLLIIDDLQISALNNHFIANIFSRESHHRNMTVFLILQKFFHQGKYARDISLNAHYIILFKNPRDTNQVKILAKQLGLGNRLIEAYKDSTAQPYGYLLIDLSPYSQDAFMLRSNIFPTEHTLVYK